MATCEQCGTVFAANSARVQRFCQRSCKERAAADRRRAPDRAAREAAKAAQRVEAERARLRTCGACGQSYGLTSVSGYKYCSASCAHRARLQYNLEYNRTRPEWVNRELVCRVDGCDRALTDRRRRRCDDCVARAEKDRKQRQRRRWKNKRRGVLSEPYTLAEIAKRDHNFCGLCRKRVAMTKVVPHPKAPTIDHVLPIAAGGEDVRANVQLAHFICNCLKSDGGTQQLALIG